MMINFCNIALKTKECIPWSTVYYRDKFDFSQLNLYLGECQMDMQCIGNGYGSIESARNNKDMVLMTYHSSKGLDFDHVFIPFANRDLMDVWKNDKDLALALFMVAMTRSRENLYITYSQNEVLRYVASFISEPLICSKINIKEILSLPNSIKNPDDIIFTF